MSGADERDPVAPGPDGSDPDETTTLEPVDQPDAHQPDEVRPDEVQPDDDTAVTPAVTPAGRGPYFLDYVGRSHVGLIRKNNQDSGYASPTVLLVADGMGGAAAGDLASAVAVAAVRDADQPASGEQMLELLSGSIRRANDKLADLVADDHALEGMGTTVSGAMFDGERLGICHIGDSRIYRIRDGAMERLTHDHSWVQSLIDDGKLTEEEAAYHPHRSLLLKVLNGHPTNDPDSSMTEVRLGDRILACSDGLCSLVDDEEILDRAQDDDLQTALDDLVEAALQAGGVDNITIVLADVVDTEPTPVLTPIQLGAVTEREIPALASVTVDLGDEEVDDSDDPVRPVAPAPTHDDDSAEDRRYAMSTAPKRRWFTRIVAVLAAVLVLGGLSAGGVAWGQTQYYVGVSGEKVAIYQGLSQNVLGIPLSRVYEVQEVTLADLPPYQRDQVTQTMPANSLEGAYQTVGVLTQAAETCRQQRQTPPPSSPPPSSPPASGSPSAPASGASSAPAPSGSASGSAPGATPAAPAATATPGTGTTPGATPLPPTGSPTSAPPAQECA